MNATSPLVPPQSPQDVELPDVVPTEDHPVVAVPTIHRTSDAPTAAPEQNLAQPTGM